MSGCRARRAAVDRARDLTAKAVEARLAGQNDIAMGADSVIDLGPGAGELGGKLLFSG